MTFESSSFLIQQNLNKIIWYYTSNQKKSAVLILSFVKHFAKTLKFLEILPIYNTNVVSMIMLHGI